ncbi:TPA: M20 family peptidase, partial [Vibrio vulnificus]
MQFSLEHYLEELKPLINVDCGTYTLEGIEYIASKFEQKFQAMNGWQVKRVDCG